MARNEKGLNEAITEIKELREDFWKNVKVPGQSNEMNPELEKAGTCSRFLRIRRIIC